MWVGFLSVLVWGTLAPLLGSILPNLRERSGMSLTSSSMMFVALSSGMVVASLAAGPLIDAYGKKKVLCTAVGIIAVALLICEIAYNPALLIVLAFAIGVGGSALVTAAHSLLADLNPDHRAASLNLLDVFFGVGGFLTTFAIIPLQEIGGLRVVLVVLAGIALLVFAFMASVRFPAPVRAAAAKDGGAGRLLGSALFLAPALLIFLYVGTEQSVFDWQVTFLMGEFSMERVAAARVLSWFPVAFMIGRIVNSRLLMRVAPSKVLIVSTLGTVAGFSVILLTSSALAASLALFCTGLFMASLYPTTLGVLSGRFTTHSGTAIGMAVTAGWLGSFAVSPTFGFVAEHSNFTAGYLVILGSSIAMLITAIVVARQERSPHLLHPTEPVRPVAI
jgi:fucose permease